MAPIAVRIGYTIGYGPRVRGAAMSPILLLLSSAFAIPVDIRDALPVATARVEVKGPERKALIAEDIARQAEGPGPVRMAVGRWVSGDLETLGSWTTLPDGRRAWQAVFRAATAAHLSLGWPERMVAMPSRGRSRTQMRGMGSSGHPSCRATRFGPCW